jgi:hypothetical protein
VDSARLALLYSGPSGWGRLDDPPPPPTGVSRVYTVVAVDGLGCVSATALSVRVTVLPSVPVGPWSPCPPNKRVGSVIVRWSPGGPTKCFARGPHAGSLRHPAQSGLPWPVFVPAAAANASVGCAELQAGSRVARAPALRTNVTFFDAAGRFVPGGLVSQAGSLFSGDMVALIGGCGLGPFDASPLDPVWTGGHWRNASSSGDADQACRWKWVDDGEAALARGAKPAGGRSWPSLCGADLRNTTSDTVDDGGITEGGPACMSAARRAGDAPFDTPPAFSARRCEAELPPCCELLRSPRNFAANTPPRFTSQPRRIGVAERVDSVLVAPLARGLSIPIVVVDSDDNSTRCVARRWGATGLHSRWSA